MKYIRTKEHIYKRLFIDQAIINECGYGECDKNLNPLHEEIVKESNTIEELCDEFVVIHKIGKPRMYKNIVPYIQCLSGSYSCSNEVVAIYGAIWTDKGLTYVAKMYKKGELCLL